MRKLFHPFWTGFTIVLILIFVILFPASIISRHGLYKTVVFTVLGVSIIWIVYFVRACIFSNFSSEENKANKTEN